MKQLALDAAGVCHHSGYWCNVPGFQSRLLRELTDRRVIVIRNSLQLRSIFTNTDPYLNFFTVMTSEGEFFAPDPEKGTVFNAFTNPNDPSTMYVSRRVADAFLMGVPGSLRVYVDTLVHEAMHPAEKAFETSALEANGVPYLEAPIRSEKELSAQSNLVVENWLLSLTPVEKAGWNY